MLLMTPAAVEFLVCICKVGWGKPILVRVWHSGDIPLAVVNRPSSSESTAEAMTNLIICAMVSMLSLKRGTGLFYERNMWEPMQIWALL